MHGPSSVSMPRQLLAISAVAGAASLFLLIAPGNARTFSPGVNGHVIVKMPSRESSVPIRAASKPTLILSPAVNGQVWVSIPLPDRAGSTAARRPSE